MKERNGIRLTKEGRRVYTKTWMTEGKTRANIILVHGIGEYCERYEHVAEFLTGCGFSLYGFDHIGHGRSEGKRGCMCFADAFSIINSFKGELLEQDPQTPVFVYGHSMGGGVVLSYGIKYPQNVSGIIATSPAVGLAKPMKPAVVGMLRTLKKILPDLTISNGLPADGISHDKTVVERYLSDPLVHDKVSVTLGLDLIDWGDFLSKYSGAYPVPLFLAQGMKDRLVDPAAAESFALKLKGNVTYKRFEEGFHELHNEPNRQELFDAMARWLNAVLSKREE